MAVVGPSTENSITQRIGGHCWPWAGAGPVDGLRSGLGLIFLPFPLYMGSLQGSHDSSAVNHMAIPELTPLPVLCGCLCARHWLKALTKCFLSFPCPFRKRSLRSQGGNTVKRVGTGAPVDCAQCGELPCLESAEPPPIPATANVSLRARPMEG